MPKPKIVKAEPAGIVNREPKPRMRTGPDWFVNNPTRHPDEVVFDVDFSGESYHFSPGETKVKVRGSAKAEDVAKQALAVHQLKGLTIRSE